MTARRRRGAGYPRDASTKGRPLRDDAAIVRGVLRRGLAWPLNGSRALRPWRAAVSGVVCAALAAACDAGQNVSPPVSPSATEAQSVGSEPGAGSGDGSTTELPTEAAPSETNETSDPTASRAADDAGAETRDPITSSSPELPSVALPPPNGGLDYQLGGGYSLPPGVTIVSRDRTDEPAGKVYNICYVNGFQVQPGEESDWDSDLLLRDEQGELVIDEDWNEVLLDVSTADKRTRIAATVGEWIRGCAEDGFDAVEIDNLDTFSRSGGRIEEDDAVAFMAALSAVAHAAGLAIAQKNSVELVARRDEMGTDFVVAEECNAWRECDGYIDAYGTNVLMIEYTAEDFERGCTAYGATFSLVLRDLDLTMPGDETYVFSSC